jgi:hypothetical protein
MSAQDFADILMDEFKGDFVFRGVTGECVNGQKSTISWNEDGTVNKKAVKYVVKQKTN